MRDDYLWDPSASPDPEVADLERALRPLRHVDKPAPIAEKPVARRDRSRAARWILLAAAVAVSAFLWAFITRSPRGIDARLLPPKALKIDDTAPRFAVERLEGAPKVGAAPIAAAGSLVVGQWLETDASSRAKIAVAEIGEVEVGEGSRIRLTATGPMQHRLDLERGAISAKVLAPPRLFVVGTPSATAFDLGCAYALEVDDQGAGALHVHSGWVSLEDGARTAVVPAGASCRTKKGAGPGTPSFDDAPVKLREALARFDFEGGGDAALGEVIALARKRDALTLWHLISRTEGAARKKVYDRLRALAPPPVDVGEPEILKLDRPALDRWMGDLRVTW